MFNKFGIRRASCCFATLFLLILAIPAAADAKELPLASSVARGVPINDNFAGRQPISLPFSTTIIDAQLATVEASEDIGGCASNVKNTVWYVITIPNAVVTVTTPGTSFDGSTDTFVNIYEGTGSLGSLTPVACNDDDGPIGSARLEISLDAGRYYVQIGKCCATAATTPSMLGVSIVLAPHGPAPANDLFANAMPLSLPYYGFTTGVQRALIEAGEPLHPCRMSSAATGSHSVWYTFTIPFTMSLTLDTLGSSLTNISGNSTDTLMSVWQGASLGSLSNVACSDDNVVTTAKLTHNFQPGTYYVQVSYYSMAQNLTGASNYALRVSSDFINGNMIDLAVRQGGFETGAAPWNTVNLNGDKKKCGGIGHTGSCAFVFKGGAGENSSISQTFKSFGSFGINAGDTFFVQFYVKPTNVQPDSFKMSLKISYTDGTPATVRTQTYGGTAGGYLAAWDTITAASSAVKKVSLKFQNKSTTGQVLVDSVLLAFQPVPARGAEALPAPVAPVGFRGGN
ncbi:MAG: hypothetical protein IPK52_09505 [Chloroflexi bacterium]|nr:hypothetical protein [Chloroflexota bacterium]